MRGPDCRCGPIDPMDPYYVCEVCEAAMEAVHPIGPPDQCPVCHSDRIDAGRCMNCGAFLSGPDDEGCFHEAPPTDLGDDGLVRLRVASAEGAAASRQTPGGSNPTGHDQ